MVFVVALGALALGMLLIALIARYSPDARHERLEQMRLREEAAGRSLYPPIPFEDWRQLVIDLLEALNFEIVIEHQNAQEVDVVARSLEPLRGGRYIVHALHSVPGDVVDQTWVIRLQDTVRGEGASKGILMTPYPVETDGLGNLEADIEIVDGQKMRELVEKYLPKKLDVIEGHRGFGVSAARVQKADEAHAVPAE